MNYLQKKKLAFMSIVNQIKGFVRTVSGIPPLTLPDCVDNDSIINYTIDGNSIQDGTPTPETPVEVESVGEKTKNLFNYADYTTLTNYNGNDISANWLTIDGDLFYIKYDYYNGGCWLTPTKQWELSSGTYTLSGKCKDNTIKGNPNICYCGVRWSDDTRNASWGKINSNDGEWYSFSYTFTISETKIVKGVYLQDNGAQAKSAICFTNIQLEEGDFATDYEPYGKYKIPVKCSGKNLFNSNDWYNQLIKYATNTLYSAPYKGKDGERSYIAVSPATGVSDLKYKPIKFKEKTAYTFSFYGKISSHSNAIGIYYTDGTKDTIYVGTNKWNRYKITSNPSKTISYIGTIWAYNTPLLYSDIQLEEGGLTDYEPYVEPTTTNIYLDEPLTEGQTINYKADNLPKLPTFKGTTIYSIDTQIQPSNMEVSYYSTAKE